MNTMAPSVLVATSWEEARPHLLAYEQLLMMQPEPSPFLTEEWLQTWWKHYGHGRDLRFVFVFRGSKLVGAAATLLRRIQLKQLTFTRLEFVGTGEDEAEEVASEYVDFLIDDDDPEQIASCIWTALRQLPFDELRFVNLLAHSFVNQYVPALATSDGLSWRTVNAGVRYFVDLPEDWKHYQASLGSRRAQQLRSHRRRIEKLGTVVELEHHHDEIPDALDTLAALHQERWQKAGKPGAFATRRFRDFHREVADKFGERGLLHLQTWNLDGVPFAALYCFRLGSTNFFYQSGYNDDVSKNASVGAYCLYRSIEQSIAIGLHRFDFMRGDASSYKSRYRTEREAMLHLHLENRSVAGTLLRGAKWAKGLLRPGLVESTG